MTGAIPDSAWYEFGGPKTRGPTVWNLNTSSSGGGVAELLTSYVPYGRKQGHDIRWSVINASPAFFQQTKKLHHLLHGQPGNEDTSLSREVYEQALNGNRARLDALIHPRDIVVLHDPQTCGLAPWLKQRGNLVIWRCHIGADDSNAHVRHAWDFLRPYLQQCDLLVASRAEHLPPGRPHIPTAVLTPAIDPTTAKNRRLGAAEARAILVAAGVLEARNDARSTSGRPSPHPPIVGGPVPENARIITQISRWDPLKDMLGVMRGFVMAADLPPDTHLILCGPDSTSITDDPEGSAVFDQCHETWRTLPVSWRQRVHLARTALGATQHNDLLINALQTTAAVVVQKSLMEGFGLTVTEAQWKGRPVLASAVGGLQDQVVDGSTGVLVQDPRDLYEFATKLSALVRNPRHAKALGEHARTEVSRKRLIDVQYRKWAELVSEQAQIRRSGYLTNP